METHEQIWLRIFFELRGGEHPIPIDAAIIKTNEIFAALKEATKDVSG